MSTAHVVSKGTAAVQGDLWSERARDWAEIQEPACRALFEQGLARAGVGPGVSHLDVGCGAGLAAQFSARRGAQVSGLDAAEALLDIARQRTPGAVFRVGEMEELPFADAAFDVVTGFNAFQYAASPKRSLEEARRVARAGARLVIATWGEPAQCEASVYLRALASVLPPPPAGAPGPFALSERGALEALASQAGFTPVALEDVACIWTYADLETALRGLLSAGPAVRAIRTAGESKVRDVVSAAIAAFRDSSGAYRLENNFRYLLARA
jgi:ubiquinone/menaquinone biosynthesis C-methylase UbiE